MSGPEVARTAAELRAALARVSERPGARGAARVGFVPTMGFLHEGHAALMRRARAECACVVVSIFVNPTQFGPGEDFSTYPRDLDRDLALLARESVDVAFVPSVNDVYPLGVASSASVGAVAEPLEGASRPGHFRGVATVVARLFELVRPARAYFGEKDWQQLQVVRQLVRDIQSPVEIVAVPIAREPDGLAMSSRNVRLSPADRAHALCVPRALAAARSAFAAGARSRAALEQVMADVIRREAGATLDYAVVADAATLRPAEPVTAASRALLAVRVGPVRLIDNGALGDSPR